jgi:replication initiation protein RepC
MDTYNSAHEAPQESFAQSPSRANGCRRVTLEMRAWLDRADSFKGLPPGTAKPLTFLYAFKEAAPYLGLPSDAYKLVDWLMTKYCSKPQDWEDGSRPIAWPQLRYQAEFLGLSERRTQELNRALQEAGIFVMRDDPQGRRYGHRDPKTGRITNAFGFDLSLLKERHEEFKKIAAEAQIERDRMKKLRQQKTIARRAIDQAAEELAAQGYDSEALQCLLQEAKELVKAGSQCDRSSDLALVVQALERRRDEIRRMLSDLIKPVETAPMGAENDTHSTSTNLIDNDKDHTVIAAKDCSPVEASPVPNGQERSGPKHLFPESLQITPAILVELAPRLAPYVPARTSDKDWPAIVDAALYLSGEMGVNRTLWARACEVMGREYAAVAIAVVSTRPAEHFTKSAGSYFGGMVKKFEKNPQELCLSRTLWRLKEQTWGKEGHKERREVEQRRRIEDRTKKSAYPALASITAKAPGHPGGGFKPAGNVQPFHAAATLVAPAVNASQTAPTVRPAVQASAGSAGASTTAFKHWRPPAGLLEEARQVGRRIRQQLEHHEDGTRPALTEPDKGSAKPAMPQDDGND